MWAMLVKGQESERDSLLVLVGGRTEGLSERPVEGSERGGRMGPGWKKLVLSVRHRSCWAETRGQRDRVSTVLGEEYVGKGREE